MKKLYSFLAAAGMALAATAAVPQPSHTLFSVNMPEVTDLSVANAGLAARTSNRNVWKAAPSRVPAAESMIDLDDETMMYVNNMHLVNSQGEFFECLTNKITKVEGKENTYQFDFFQFFSDVELKPLEGVLDPETGKITIDSDVVLATSGNMEVRFRHVGRDDNGWVCLDEPVVFMLEECCVASTEIIGLEITDVVKNDSWVNMLLPEVLIGPCNTIATDIVGLPVQDATGNVSTAQFQRSYGLFSYALDGKTVAFMNLFNCGEWSYVTEGKLDMKRNTLTFEDAVLFEINIEGDMIPATLVDGNGSPYVEIDYNEKMSFMNQTVVGFELGDGFELFAGYMDKNLAFESYSDIKIAPLVNYFDAMAGTAEIEADNTNAPVEYFNLQGVRVNNPENGVYIRRQGSDVQKVLVK